MMEHEHPREQLSEWVDGTLAAHERDALGRHLEACADCRAAEARLRATVGALGALRAPAPPDLLRGVQSQIRRRSRGRFYGAEAPLRFPFEWVSLVLIVALWAAYLVVTAAGPREIRPAPTPTSPLPRRTP